MKTIYQIIIRGPGEVVSDCVYEDYTDAEETKKALEEQDDRDGLTRRDRYVICTLKLWEKGDIDDFLAGYH